MILKTLEVILHVPKIFSTQVEAILVNSKNLIWASTKF